MYEDDQDLPETDTQLLEDHRDPHLQRRAAGCREKVVQITLAELRRALAVLAVLEMDEDEGIGEPLWVH